MNAYEYDEEEYPENPQLSVAAALQLLSSVGVHGANVARCAALLRHLERLLQDQCLADPLRSTCVQLYSTWKKVLQSIQPVDPGSVDTAWIESFDSMPRTSNGRRLH
jgi:hypothetical protein